MFRKRMDGFCFLKLPVEELLVHYGRYSTTFRRSNCDGKWGVCIIKLVNLILDVCEGSTRLLHVLTTSSRTVVGSFRPELCSAAYFISNFYNHSLSTWNCPQVIMNRIISWNWNVKEKLDLVAIIQLARFLNWFVQRKKKFFF